MGLPVIVPNQLWDRWNMGILEYKYCGNYREDVLIGQTNECSINNFQCTYEYNCQIANLALMVIDLATKGLKTPSYFIRQTSIS